MKKLVWVLGLILIFSACQRVEKNSNMEETGSDSDFIDIAGGGC